MPIDAMQGGGTGPAGGPPIRLAPPEARAAPKRGPEAADAVIPAPFPDNGPPVIPDMRFVSVPRREIESRLDPSTGRSVFRINVNGVQLEVPPAGWLA